MATVPTGKLERELRRLYMRWVNQLPRHEKDLHNYVAKFQKQSMNLIEKMGGEIARRGVLVDFPAPKRLDLSPHIGTIYSDMELAAISAQIGLGLNPRQTAEALVQAGVDKNYRRLERLARTETVRAYWKNSWDSVEGLGLVMLWAAERGPRTCEWCLSKDGMVVPSREIRDHPNGRCTLVAELPSMVDYKGSVASDGSIYNDPDWNAGASRPRVNSNANPTQVDINPTRNDLDLWEELPRVEGDDTATNTALRRYQSSDFEPINLYLREGSEAVIDEWGAKALERAKARSELIRNELNKHTLPTDVSVWRWQQMDGLESLGDLSDAVGKVWRSDGFLSTTLDPGTLPTNPPVRIQILAPAGSKGARLDLINDLEKEVLFPDGGEYTVINAVKEGETWTIQMVLTKQK